MSFAGSTQAIQVELGALGTTGHGYSWDGVAQDGFTGMENAIGSAFADYIVGDSAANSLEGGLGNDYLNGGLGNDTFVFSAALFGTDTIADSKMDRPHQSCRLRPQFRQLLGQPIRS